MARPFIEFQASEFALPRSPLFQALRLSPRTVGIVP
jgi:hypothetical protein